MAMNPRLLRPLASGFNPRQIAGLVGWWDAADAATVTVDTGAVAQINDKSGLGRHATQTTPNNRPAYSGSINGRNVMTFDGVNDFLITGLPSDSLTGFPTFFVVCQVDATWSDATANNKAAIFARNADLTNAYGLNLTTSAPLTGTLGIGVQWRSAGFNYSGSPEVTKGVPRLFVGGPVATGRIRRVNGNANNATGFSTTAGTNAAAGRFLHIGEDPGLSRWWSDIIAEVLVYDRTLTVDEIKKLEQALGTKWGLTITP